MEHSPHEKHAVRAAARAFADHPRMVQLCDKGRGMWRAGVPKQMIDKDSLLARKIAILIDGR